QSPSEYTFQAELYACMRSLIPHETVEEKQHYNIYFEAKKAKQLDLMVSDHYKFGYETKVNKLYSGHILEAVQQAEVYCVNMEINDMWMINFVPNGHKMDESLKVKYPLQSYPNVNVAHIFHNSLCNEFTINYLDIDSGNEKQTVIKSA
ncbi:786_t:CDS:1, partial [Paraglomus brasilianum]